MPAEGAGGAAAPPERCDVAILGAGLAGLAAAYRLRHRDVVVLEADMVPGGRVRSTMRDGLALNLGAHMFGGTGSRVGALLAEMDIAARPIPSRLAGMILDGRRHLRAPPWALPMVLPLSVPDRAGLLRAGLHLTLPRGRNRAEVTLAARIGALPGRVPVLVEAITERTGAAPGQMNVAHALRSFANVWRKGAPGQNLCEGGGALPAALVDALCGAVHTGCRVTQVLRRPDGVTVRYVADGTEKVLQAAACVIALPAPVAHAVAPDLPEPVRAALAAIRYGPFLTLALRTDEDQPMPWDDVYAIATPDLSFSVLFNHAGFVPRAQRRGSALMLFRGADGAAGLMQGTDEGIVSAMLADLDRCFPELRNRVRDVILTRWPQGAPYGFPGRAALQPALTTDLGRVVLAGDYLDFPNMEAAIASGEAAAARLDRGGDAAGIG